MRSRPSLIIPVLLALLLPGALCAQSPTPAAAQMETAQRFLDSYNRQDFKAMRSTFSGVFKVVFRKKTLAALFGTQYKTLGPARLVAARQRSASSVKLELAYAADTTEIVNFGLSFTKKNKIIGFGSSNSEKFEFPPNIPAPRTPEAQKRLAARIDSLLRRKYDAGAFCGCLGVVDGGRVLYSNCYGYGDRNTRAPLDESTVFELASCSKQFTAMGIMLLAGDGQLRYSDDVRTFIPEFPYPGISVEDLLTHTGGLPEYEELFAKHWDKSKIAQNADVVALLARYKPKTQFKPGQKHEYSNTGYVMLAVIIERVSGLSYGAFLERRIFAPLDMTHTRVYNTRRAHETIPHYALGYVHNQGGYSLPDSLPEYDYVRYLDGITGDGTVNSCLTDLYTWENALREHKLVPAQTLQQAFSPRRLKDGTEVPYGFGWEIQHAPKFAPLVYHSGGWPGYATFILHFEDRPASVIVLSNNDYLFVPRLAKRVAKLLEE